MFRLLIIFSVLSTIVLIGTIESQEVWDEGGDEDLRTFFEAIENGDLRLVKHMIEDGIDVNNHGYKNNATALHVAAQFGNEEIVRILLANAAQVNAEDAQKMTPLHYAVKYGHKNSASLLICPGATTDKNWGNASISDEDSESDWWSVGATVTLTILAILMAIMIGLIIYLHVQYRQLKKNARAITFPYRESKKSALKSKQVQALLNGEVHLLPYDTKFEFSRQQMSRGKRIGLNGAFGRLEEAIAYGIVPNEKMTRVTIKTPNNNSDTEELKALISELKILGHLGRHLNVIALLGAVTKNIVQRELIIILEHCRFGSLKYFIPKHRRFFVDQIDADRDEIDFSIVEQQNENTELSRSSSASSLSTAVVVDDLDLVYPLRTISTTDLLCWSYQIARGMEFMASRNVVHGDLAARSVLLCDGNVVKICDLCLAQPKQSDPHHKKAKISKGTKLPFKWLAPELHQTFEFSTATDVWSFGILIWELFSLCEEPYQDFSDSKHLLRKLNEGYRMSKPVHATERIYATMLSCWNEEPTLRPRFDQLAMLFSQIMGAERTKYFDDLNASYLANES